MKLAAPKLAAAGIAASIAAAAGIVALTREPENVRDLAAPVPTTQVKGIQLTPPPAVPQVPEVPPSLQDLVRNLPQAAPRPLPPAVTTTTVVATTPPPVRQRSVQRPNPINCQDSSQAQLCTDSHAMTVSGGKVHSRTASTRQGGTSFPTFTMSSEPLRADGRPAGQGDAVSTVVIKLALTNQTDRSFVVPEGDLGVKMTKDAKEIPLPVQKQGNFVMRPGARLDVTYEIPFTGDGTYIWYGETFFYEG